MELNFELLEKLYADFISILPKIIGTLVFIIAGWIFIKIVLLALKRILKLVKIDSLKTKLNENDLLKNSSFKINPQKIILGFVKWSLILILIVLGSDIFGLTVVSREAGKLVAYLPKIFSAVIIFIAGLYLASIVKKAMKNMLKTFDLKGSKLISLFIFYLIVIVVSITALNQAGVNTQIITNNLSLILGAFLAAFTIAIGLGSRDIVYRLMLGFYSKKNFEIGSRVKIGKKEGIIVSIDNICMVVKTSTEKIVYPIKGITDKKIEILD